VADEDGTIAERSVRIGQTADGMVEILEGLSPGAKVVTSGALFIDRAARSSPGANPDRSPRMTRTEKFRTTK
jgi:multidrug efflux pump subunit AcrA (membrane-fusion protein)